MAGTQIPGLENNTPQFSENVPGVALPRRGEFGEQGQAVEHLGQTVENLANTGGEIYDEVQRQHDISTSSKNYVDAGVAHSQQLQNLKLSSPDGFIHDPQSGEVEKNSDGSQRTIAQEYWAWADSDYQERQKSMTPRAAAMFRQQMQSEIGTNTRLLQNEQLVMQQKASETDISQSMDKLQRANQTNPWSDSNPYYQQVMPDGSVVMRGNTDKINDQLRTLQLWSTRQGPADGKPGMYNPEQVKAYTASRLSSHADSWVEAALTDTLENNGPRDKKNHVSATTYQQLMGIRDIVEGKDPQSAQAQRKGLPTVNSSLTADQIDKFRSKINSLKSEAQDIDKSEYKLALEQLKQSAHGSTSIQQFMSSPLFQHTLHSGEPLGMTADERVKDLAEPFAIAVTSSGISGVNGLSSDAAKRAAATQKLQDAATLWPQLAKQLGVKDTDGFGQAIIAEASRQVESKLQEDSRQRREDPMKYAASIQQGPNGPGGTPQYRSQMAKAVDDHLASNPSIQQIFNRMSNGKSALENAQETANSVYTRSFGPRADVVALQKGQFEDQKNRLLSSRDPQQIESYFQRLDGQKISQAQKESYEQQLVSVGGLPQPYIDALRLKTRAEREARWANLLAGSTPMQEWAKNDNGESEKVVFNLSQQHNKDLFSFVDRKYGQNSPEARKAKNDYDQSWQSDYTNGRQRGMGQSDAATYADQMRDKTTSSVGIVSAQHNFLGFHWGSTGPQVPVEFGRSDLAPEQKQIVQKNLLRFQGEQELSKYKFVPVPGAAPNNPNAPTEAKWISEHAFLWDRIPGGYRLRVQEMSRDGQPTGNSQPAQVYGSDGKPHYYDVQDRDALAAPTADTPPAVKPAGKQHGISF